MLSGELELPHLQAGVHHLHHGGSFPAPPDGDALPLHPHRNRAVDPQEGRGRFSSQHHEPQGDRQDFKVDMTTGAIMIKKIIFFSHKKHQYAEI